MPIKIALIISVILQFFTAVIAITLIRRTRSNIAWWLISIGFVLMAIRRLFELMQVYDSQSPVINGLLSSWTGIAISMIMLISLLFIKRIFNIQKRIDNLRKENESRVLSAIIKTEEIERQKFAKELHDGLGPLLSSVKMAISAISKNPKHADKKVINNTAKLIDESITTIKEISYNLSPHILNHFGIIKAVNSFISKIQTDKTPQITFNSNLEDKRLNYNIEVVIYRVICELLTNSLKHASADKINIDLILDNKILILEYYDDGIGFNTDEILKENIGMGYSNIQSRIKSLNGNYNVISKINEGVNITISVNIN
ncbi:ATP-binding protein [Bacteroidota bacterium]